MCGLAGYLSFDHTGAEGMQTLVRAMTSVLVHRGPDDGGDWTDPDAGVALGHRRLAIIDLSPQGHQPMRSSSGRYVIAYNGEIYNFEELRRDLDRAGYQAGWRGHSDTEVMLAAFEHWGIEESLRRFNGMFAFALWDRTTRTLYLARDRFGEKPLYYGRAGASLLFGSELKALGRHPSWEGELHRGALDLYMRMNFIPGPWSIYKGILKLPAGCLVTVRLERSSRSIELTEPVPYWSALDAAMGALDRRYTDRQQAIADLDSALSNAVAIRTRSDVPLGAFLSGGVDSTLVVALMQEKLPHRVKTFTIGYDDRMLNEAEYAKAIASYLGTEHSEHFVTPEEVRSAIVRIPDLYDEPFSDVSQVPTHLVSMIARRQVTVSLTGDGGDELFGGYNRYFIGQTTWRTMKRFPMFVRSALAALLESIPPILWDRAIAWVRMRTNRKGLESFSGDRLHKLAAALRASSPRAMYSTMVSRSDTGMVPLPQSERLLNPFGRMDAISDKFTEAETMMLLDTIGVLCDDFLVKVDRASMGVSLETRTPFLDPDVFDLAWRIPPEWKMSSTQGKLPLRELLYKRVPKELVDRSKQGFVMPIGTWLRGPLREWADDLLNERRLQEQGLLDSALIRQAWHQHLKGTHDRQYFLWSVLVFQRWLESIHTDSHGMRQHAVA